MDRRAAKRAAHAWVADVIEGALGNGSGDDFRTDNDADFLRVENAIRDIQHEHERKADR